MHYKIREIVPSEYPLLEDFLPPCTLPQVYVEGFGTHPGDTGFITEIGGKPAGAVWARIMEDDSHMDNDTPSFAISLYEPYRSMGIGTAMMRKAMDRLRQQGYRRASLAVPKGGNGLKLCRNVGFEIMGENEREYLMACKL